MRGLVALLVLVAACQSRDGTTVEVSVSATSTLSDVARLAVTATVGARTRTAQVILGTKSIPPTHVFAIDVAGDVGGTMTVAVDARDSSDVSVGTHSGSVVLAPGALVPLALQIGAVHPDLATDANPAVDLVKAQVEFDLANSDVFAAADDLADPSDLTTFDLTKPTCDNIFGDRATQVCMRWKCDRMDVSEGTWTGTVGSCVAGDNVAGRANAFKMWNLYRFIASAPQVTRDTAQDQSAQQCALVMDAENNPSLPIQNTMQCYTPTAEQMFDLAAGSPFPAVQTIDRFMVDQTGIEMSHRRLALSSRLSTVGVGTTSTYSCFNGDMEPVSAPTPEFVAWPPPGPIPVEALSPYGLTVDAQGWSIQSSKLNMNTSTVQVADTSNLSQLLAVTTTTPTIVMGDLYSIRFVPSGWSTQAGHTYRVTLQGGSLAAPIEYDVEVVNCP